MAELDRYLEQALGAGARFVVTPVLSEEVLAAWVERRIPCLPGAATPTEIWRPARLGADVAPIAGAMTVFGEALQ